MAEEQVLTSAVDGALGALDSGRTDARPLLDHGTERVKHGNADAAARTPHKGTCDRDGATHIEIGTRSTADQDNTTGRKSGQLTGSTGSDSFV